MDFCPRKLLRVTKFHDEYFRTSKKMQFFHSRTSKIESVLHDKLYIMNKEVKSKSCQQDCVTIQHFLNIFRFWKFIIQLKMQLRKFQDYVNDANQVVTKTRLQK